MDERTPPPDADAPAPPPPTRRPSGLGFLAVLLALFPCALLAQQAAPLPGLLWTDLFALALPGAVVACGWNLRPGPALGVTRWPGLGPLALAALLGVAGFFAGAAALLATYAVVPQSWIAQYDVWDFFRGPAWERVGLMVAAVAVAPVCEELTFRGWMLTALRHRHRPAVAIVLAALVFAALHMDPVRFAALIPLGALFGWLAWRAGSVWPAVVAHLVNNGLGFLLARGEPPAGQPLRPTREDLLLALGYAGAALLVAAPLAALYQRATRAPPLEELLERLDPEDERPGFRLLRVPGRLLVLAALGAAMLAGLATFGRHGR